MTDKLREAAQQAEREAFERALASRPDARFWNAADAMFWAWQARAALAQQDAQVPRSTSPTALRPYDPTEQMRWAAKQLDPALTHEQIRALWCAMWSAAPTPPAQQDAQAESSIIWQNKLLADALGACILASGIVRKDIEGLTGPQLLLFAEDLREMLEAKSAQQDAQACVGCNGIGVVGNILDTVACPFCDGSGKAAPTPPAQRVMLTDDEIERLWYPSAAIAEPGTRRVAFGRAVIEAYERKNGISQPGYTAPDMASQGASQFRAGHDAAQSEIAELEQENRLLRARNDRLQKEIEQKGER